MYGAMANLAFVIMIILLLLSGVGLVASYPISATSHLKLRLDWDNDIEKDLIEIAYHMVDWEEKLCPHLGLTHTEIHDIKAKYKDNPVLQRCMRFK